MSESKIKLSELEDFYRNMHDCKLKSEGVALCKAARAAKEVIDFVNPMFCDTDECLVKLRESLSPFDWSGNE